MRSRLTFAAFPCTVTPRLFLACCAILMVAALGLRLPGLSERSISIDEIATREIGRDLSWQRIGGRPPLSFFLAAGALQIHDSQTMLLLPAVLFGAATVFLIGWTGRVAFHWRVGFVAGLWILLSPLHVRYSQYARYYSIMIFLSLWCYLLLDLWLRMRRWRYLALWFVAATLNVSSHFFASFVVGLQAGVVLIALAWMGLTAVFRGRNVLKAAILLCAFGAVAIGAWASYTLTGLDDLVRSQLAEKRPWETPGVDISWAFWGPYLHEMTSWPRGFLAAALILFVVGLVGAWMQNKLFLLHTLFLLIVPIVVVVFAQPAHFFDIRYVSFVLPFFLITLAVGLVTLWQLAVRLIPWPAAGIRPAMWTLATVVILAPLLQIPTFAHTAKGYEYRDLVRYVEQMSQPGDTVLFVNPLDEIEFRYFRSTNKPLNVVICQNWNEISSTYYPNRVAQPFWLVTGRLHTQPRKEMEWALNTFSHQAFDWGYVFYGNKHVELNLDPAVLRQARCALSPQELPSADAGLEAFRLSVFIPRTWDYYISLNQKAAGCLCRREGESPARWFPLTPAAGAEGTKIRLAEGLHHLTLAAPRGTLEGLSDLRLRILPACGSTFEINPVHFDYIRGLWNLDCPTVYQGRFGLQLRMWAQLSYPIFVEKAGPYEFALTADNDRPGTNVVSLWINRSRVHQFQFSRRDNSLETQRTIVNLNPGLQTITLHNEWYRGVDTVRNGPVPDLYKSTFLAAIAIRAVSYSEAAEYKYTKRLPRQTD